jgi:quercetin dioxygenase-like cupin family protein
MTVNPMRPHVELIDERDLLWHVAELPHSEGEARQQNLSYDEEDGSASLRVNFATDWRRGPGLHAAQTEWFVLEGRVQFGDHTLHKGGYWCAPKGVASPEIRASAGTRILLFREFGDWGFTPGAASDADAELPLVVKDSEAMEWFDVVDPENGSPMNFERGGTPVPGLYIKLLYRDPRTGFYTRLIKAKPGWREHPLAHHPVFEEAYCLDGDFDYNYGLMTPGQYFFRPAGIRHGDFTAGEKDGCTWILRCDGDLVDWYTDNARVEMKGDPVNWGEGFPDTDAPVFVQPVRSRSVGPWKDPSYQ